jgi:hypothetical protein
MIDDPSSFPIRPVVGADDSEPSTPAVVSA